MSANAKVSVIITTKNESRDIKSCLQSIKDQAYKNIEIVVIDNKSTDKTVDIARAYTPYVYTKGPERSAQRNFGIQKSTGVFVVFIDADMVLTKHVISDCVALATKNKFVAITIAEQSIGTGFWAACKALERSFYLGVDWIEASRFFRKSIFAYVKPYDETLTGPEDFDLSQRVITHYGRALVGRTSELILHNEGALRLIQLLKKKYYYGLQMRRYSKKKQNISYTQKQSSLWRRYILFFTHPSLLFKRPMVGIGMLYMKTLEMGALASGYLVGILRNS